MDHALAQQFPPRRDDVVRQFGFQRRQAAALDQGMVGLDLAEQSFLRGQRQHLILADAERARRLLRLARDGRGDRGIIAQLVPQVVDLVQHHQTSLVAAAAERADMMIPDFQVGFGDAGIGRQHEQHRLCVRQHAQRQFRLGAECIESGGVEHHQSLLQHGMRKIDDRVTPHGNLHAAVAVQHVRHGLDIVTIKTERFRLFAADRFGHDGLLKGLGQIPRRIQIQRHHHPRLRRAPVFRNGGGGFARLDGQEFQARRFVVIVAQLRGAHGRATGLRRQQTLPVVGEENGVDEFGFAAREFGDQRDGELVGAQCVDEFVKLQVFLAAGEAVAFDPGLVFVDNLD